MPNSMPDWRTESVRRRHSAHSRRSSERNRALQSYERMVNSMQEAADLRCRRPVRNRQRDHRRVVRPTRKSIEGQTSRLVRVFEPRVRQTVSGTARRNAGELSAKSTRSSPAMDTWWSLPTNAAGDRWDYRRHRRRNSRRYRAERARTGATPEQRAIDEAPVGVTITDPNQYGIHAIRFDHYREDRAIARRKASRTPANTSGENTDPEPVDALRDAIDAGEQVSVELRNYRKDGTEFWNRVRIAPVRDDDGTVVNTSGSSRIPPSGSAARND